MRMFAQIDTSPLPHQTSFGGSDIQKLLTLVFTVAGSIAVILVIIGGIKYITSQGDPQSVSKAKQTIIYALVGLIICIFAVAIVQFVIGRVL